jgi:hypothetical protein
MHSHLRQYTDCSSEAPPSPSRVPIADQAAPPPPSHGSFALDQFLDEIGPWTALQLPEGPPLNDMTPFDERDAENIEQDENTLERMEPEAEEYAKEEAD